MVHRDNFVVAIKCDGKILREKDGNVTLPFGCEYSILLKNLDSRKAVVGVDIDGKTATGKRRIIVRPNDSVELQGFKEESEVRNKFKFIQKTKEIVEHRGDRIDDGVVRVEVTFEKRVTKETRQIEYWHTPWYDWDRWPYTFSRYDWDRWPYTFSRYDNSWTTSLDESPKRSVNYLCAGSSSSIVAESAGTVEKKKSYFYQSDPDEDEGITVKGSKSDQKFVTGYTKQLEEESHVIILRLRGTDSKNCEVCEPITTKTKLECETCGVKSRSSAKFCYNCGTCLE